MKPKSLKERYILVNMKSLQGNFQTSKMFIVKIIQNQFTQ